ncbi:MAG: 50S ribosomal protein L13 [Phycisphaerae bacterium]|jgi:large subunit ribosomal protein L13
MKTANKSYLAKPGAERANWYVVDATDQVLGRLATRIATVLMGKHKPTYTPHVDTGDFVIVLNAGRVKVTGRKKDTVEYDRYSGHPGGRKVTTMRTTLERHPERVLEAAVRRMLPKNSLAAHMLKKLKVYSGGEHRHQAQLPEPLPQ